MVASVMLHVRGQGMAPQKAIVAFVVSNRWAPIDWSMMVFLEVEGTAANGWEGYRKLLWRAL